MSDVTTDLLDLIEATHPCVRSFKLPDGGFSAKVYSASLRAFERIVELENQIHRQHLAEIRRFGT